MRVVGRGTAGERPFTKFANKATGTVLKERAAQDGMLTLRQDGWRRVLRGQTTVEEVIRITQADDEMME
jgi:type II secretory ATPase GspE/PulE/Tfp pilus assembly ATPase PilB-like protein